MDSRSIASLLEQVEGLRAHHVPSAATPSRLIADSREAGPGTLFIATRGMRSDAHDYVPQVIEAGAAGVLVAQDWLQSSPVGGPAAFAERHPNVALLSYSGGPETLGLVAAAWYSEPSSELTLVGITGTNGKTTVATLCDDAARTLGLRSARIGTTGVYLDGKSISEASHTTPNALALQATLRQLADAGCEYVFAEVSSHALVQQRTAACRFAGGVFTNISHDHLDYHGDMLSYIEAKKLLFDQLPASAFALVNADDKRGEVMLQNTRAKRLSYALRRPADYKARLLDESVRGLHLQIDQHEVHTRLAGRFNAYNLLAAYGVLVQLDHEPEDVLRALSELRGAAGRLEPVGIPGVETLGLVDYAHTPDALENVLTTLQGERRAGHQVITVVGCGGDRDRTKRPLMGKIAAKLSDRVIVTDDNPRTEPAQDIRRAVLSELSVEERARTLELGNRREAIRAAVALAHHRDVILVAGKGHERYQEVDGVRHDFDDVAVLRSALQEKAGAPTQNDAST